MRRSTWPRKGVEAGPCSLTPSHPPFPMSAHHIEPSREKGHQVGSAGYHQARLSHPGEDAPPPSMWVCPLLISPSSKAANPRRQGPCLFGLSTYKRRTMISTESGYLHPG